MLDVAEVKLPNHKEGGAHDLLAWVNAEDALHKDIFDSTWLRALEIPCGAHAPPILNKADPLRPCSRSLGALSGGQA